MCFASVAQVQLEVLCAILASRSLLPETWMGSRGMGSSLADPTVWNEDNRRWLQDHMPKCFNSNIFQCTLEDFRRTLLASLQGSSLNMSSGALRSLPRTRSTCHGLSLPAQRPKTEVPENTMPHKRRLGLENGQKPMKRALLKELLSARALKCRPSGKRKQAS